MHRIVGMASLEERVKRYKGLFKESRASHSFKWEINSRTKGQLRKHETPSAVSLELPS